MCLHLPDNYLSILPDDNANIFAAALLMLFCNFSPLIFSLIVMTTLYTPYNTIFRKQKTLSEGRVVSKTKK